ncbi:MAG: DUF928 domain-containing protein [Waterburya sp.]
MIFTFIFIYCFNFNSISLANLLGNFKVTRQGTKVDQQRTVGSGSRSGCEASVPTKSVELLVPNTKVAHQTFSERPTLYLSSHIKRPQPLIINLTLINPQISKTLVQKRISITSKGIKQIVLPPSVELQENTIYLWKIGIPCKNNLNSYQAVLSAGIEKVSLPTNLMTKLTSQKSNIEKVNIYAQHGFWYDAIDLAVKQFQEQELYSFFNTQ